MTARMQTRTEGGCSWEEGGPGLEVAPPQPPLLPYRRERAFGFLLLLSLTGGLLFPSSPSSETQSTTSTSTTKTGMELRAFKEVEAGGS